MRIVQSTNPCLSLVALMELLVVLTPMRVCVRRDWFQDLGHLRTTRPLLHPESRLGYRHHLLEVRHPQLLLVH